MALINLSDDVKREIGSRILNYIQTGLNVEGRMPQWWADVERQYRNEDPGFGDNANGRNKGYKQFHVPLSQPRLDMLSAQITTVIGKQNPYMTDMEDAEDIAEARQNLGHEVWKDAGFEQRIRQAATIAGCTDLAYIRVCPNYAQRGSLEMNVIHPEAVSVYPALPQGIQACTCIGHRLWQRRYVVDSLMDDNYYYKVSRLPAGTQDEYDVDQEQQHTGAEYGDISPDHDSELIELWPCVVRLDLDKFKNPNSEGTEEKLYRATIEFKTGNLLCLEDYEFPYIWYFRTQLIGSPRYYYSGQSVGRNLFPVQDIYNTSWSTFFACTMQAASGGPVFGEGLNSGEKSFTFGMTDIIETDSPVTPWQGSVKFDGAPFPAILERCEQIADQVARISQNTTGAQATGQTTATEQSIIAAGVAVGLEGYIAKFSEEFGMMMSLTMAIIASDFEAYKERYGSEEQVNPNLVLQ